MEIQPYLFFDGRCDEAIAFYRQALGAQQVMLMRFKDCPEPGMAPPGSEDKVMHARLQVGDATLLLSDGRATGQPNFQGFALSVLAPDVATAEQRFAALSEGGEVRMPLGKTFFSPAFGMVADRFGVTWMVYVGS